MQVTSFNFLIKKGHSASCELNGLSPVWISLFVGVVRHRVSDEQVAHGLVSVFRDADADGIARVMECFEKNYRKFLRTEDLSLMKEEYESLLLNKDRQVRIIEKTGQWQGTARGINDRGELLVEDSRGYLREIMSGEVSVRGLYTYV